ncbi:MAG: toll/interleukin-1 receptor domain-containing protein [Aggregatilineales bacterium]
MNYTTDNNANTNYNSDVPTGETLEINLAEQQRRSLRRALTKSPGDPALHEAYTRLTNGRNLIRSADNGVFISYTRSDELFAVDLAMALQDAGVNVWLDSLHVVDSQDWRKQIENALRTSGLVLAIISPESFADQEATVEREYAISSGKMLMPVISQRVRLNEVRFWQPPIDCTRNFDIGVKHIISMITTRGATV